MTQPSTTKTTLDVTRDTPIGLGHIFPTFSQGVNVTKKKGFGSFDVAAYWKRKYRGTAQDEGWYILTNLGSLGAALDADKAPSGIEAMFKDCQSGGYNLEGSHASVERLTRLVLLTRDRLYLCWTSRSKS